MPGWQKEAPIVGLTEYSPQSDLSFISWSLADPIRHIGEVSVLQEHLPENIDAICQNAFEQGQNFKFVEETGKSDNKQRNFTSQLSKIWAYHPHAPVTLSTLEVVGAAKKIKEDQTATNYHDNRWDSLDKVQQINAKLFSLILIEIASYTELIHAFMPMYKYFFPDKKFPVTASVRDEDKEKFSKKTLEKIQAFCFAMGLRTAAQNYLTVPFVASVFQPNRTLPAPLYAWMAILHAPNPPEAKLSEFRKARALCYSLLANQKYAEFLAKVTEMQTTCPGCISEEYLKKAQGI